MDKDEALKAMKEADTLKSHVLIMILFDTICFLSNPHNTPIQILKKRLNHYLSQYEKDLTSSSVQYIQDHVDKISEFLDKTFSYSSILAEKVFFRIISLNLRLKSAIIH